jgi:hypothetical protein
LLSFNLGGDLLDFGGISKSLFLYFRRNSTLPLYLLEECYEFLELSYCIKRFELYYKTPSSSFLSRLLYFNLDFSVDKGWSKYLFRLLSLLSSCSDFILLMNIFCSYSNSAFSIDFCRAYAIFSRF